MALAHALLNQIAFSPLLLCPHSHARRLLSAYARVVDLHGSALLLHLPSLEKSPIESSFGYFSASEGESGSDQLIVSLS